MSRIKVRDCRGKKITFKDIEVGQFFETEKYEPCGIYIKAFEASNDVFAVNVTDGMVKHLVCEDDEVTPVEAELVIKWMGVREE